MTVSARKAYSWREERAKASWEETLSNMVRYDRCNSCQASRIGLMPDQAPLRVLQVAVRMHVEQSVQMYVPEADRGQGIGRGSALRESSAEQATSEALNECDGRMSN